MSEKLVSCPECKRRVRACNLARHRDAHLPTPEHRQVDFKRPNAPIEQGHYTYFAQAKQPLLQHRTHDHRYDEAFPRGDGQFRFRIYRLRGGELQLVAAADTPANYGIALLDLKRLGEFIPDDSTGVLDTADEPGGWIVHPFALGRTRQP